MNKKIIILLTLCVFNTINYLCASESELLRSCCSSTPCFTLPTILEVALELQENVTVLQTFTTNIFEVQEILCEKFEQTWTILADMQSITTVFFQETFTALEELISQIPPDPCAPTIIFTSTTITNSGSYCLARNIMGPITISANNVQLDLNKHIVFGTISSSGFERIEVINGTIRDSGAAGLDISDCSNVIATDLNFINNANGILAVTTTCFTINQCNFEEQSDEAILINTTTSLLLFNSNFSFNHGDAVVRILNSGTAELSNLFIHTNTPIAGIITCIDIDNSDNCIINQCSMLENVPTSTFIGVAFNQTSNCIVQDSELVGNGNAGITDFVEAIKINNAFDTLVTNCDVLNNVSSLQTVGIEDFSGVKTFVTSCIIAGNQSSSGSGLTRGIVLSLTTTGCILDNAITFNTSSGTSAGIFVVGTITDCQIENNIISQNVGSVSSLGIFYSVPPTLASTVWANECQGHTTNFSPAGFAAVIPLVNFTTSTGLFAATATTSGREKDNVNILP